MPELFPEHSYYLSQLRPFTQDEERRAATQVAAIAARLHPDTAAAEACDVLQALGLIPYREAT